MTSEGQGYALLRAVWERDEEAYHRIAEWTRVHLQRPDRLHAWLWTPEGGGRIIDPNTATDGDLEIAWALLLGADVFGHEPSRTRAAEILHAVRTRAALTMDADPLGAGAEAAGEGASWFPAAGDWAVTDRIVNLSYFLPYAHPWFASVDPAGRWDRVTETGYRLLERSVREGTRRLPPAFIRLDQDGSLHELPASTALETIFSFDAVRTYWRVEADCRLHGRSPACQDPLGLQDALPLLIEGSDLTTRYAPDGARLSEDHSPTFHAALLSAARRYAPDIAERVLEPRLDGGALGILLEARDRYYDHNWVWFGLALDRGLIERRTPRPPPGPATAR